MASLCRSAGRVCCRHKQTGSMETTLINEMVEGMMASADGRAPECPKTSKIYKELKAFSRSLKISEDLERSEVLEGTCGYSTIFNMELAIQVFPVDGADTTLNHISCSSEHEPSDVRAKFRVFIYFAAGMGDRAGTLLSEILRG
ncbi:hypothetical protein K438DRAFT_1772212 [Mycena galopus ATCC 62051]|nr:hypothetical protein K438DRAFT_1772212 [Mycena galopus ATCC 62051]